MFDGARAPGASFVSARLEFADFSHAELQGADLSGADLSRANLHGVRDAGASYSEAITSGMERDDADRKAAEEWRPPTRDAYRGD
jgi:uncharacterized protein YjbI with pentapeptide repeats